MVRQSCVASAWIILWTMADGRSPFGSFQQQSDATCISPLGSGSLNVRRVGMLFTRKLGTFVLGVVFLTSGATLTMARNRDNHCQEKVRKAEEKLRHEEQKHGRNNNRQLEKDRRAVEQARNTCNVRRDYNRH